MRSIDAPALSALQASGPEATLTALIDGVESALGPDLVGVYLVGSFALGAAYDQSDVDFAVVARRPVSEVQLADLRRLHAAFPDLLSHGADHLEGSYMSQDALKSTPGVDDVDSPDATATWWYVDNGARVLENSRHDDSLAFRWVLRQHGIALRGPEPRTLLDAVDPDAMRTEAQVRLASWRQLLISDADAINDSWAQTHFVTGICRLLYTIATGEIASKESATRWAQTRVDPGWSPLLEAAIAARATTWRRLGQSISPDLRDETIRFARQVAG